MRRVDSPRPERNKEGAYKLTMGGDPRMLERVRERVKQLRKERLEPAKYAAHLKSQIAKIDEWGREKGIEKIVYVSGLMVTRNNSHTGALEVLLVTGNESETGKPKEFWQFPGGKVKEGDSDHVAALRREIKDELGVDIPSDLFYVKTYVPRPKADEPNPSKVLAIHAFSLPTDSVDWDVAKGNVTLGGDVSEMIWTSDPFRDENGHSRVLTPQTDYLLRNVMGYEGPLNKNTDLDNETYFGDPTVLDRS